MGVVAGAAWLLGRSARELTLFAAAGLAIGGIDDLAVDLLWLARRVWRHLTVYRRHAPATMESLPPPDRPGRLAIIIAAWQEGEVIGRMLAAAVARLDHPDYRIYVGTYPNDPATNAAVTALGDPRIRLVPGTRPGPTTKAECLNRVWRALIADVEAEGVAVKAVVLHDAEDVVHPLELRLFDRLIERFDLVQLPVLPLVSSGNWWARAISATYVDEFAEAHVRQLPVREALGAGVPSAGVGCAIGRAAIGRIAAAQGGEPFDEQSLTEDYEIGLKLKAAGGRGAFVTIPAAPGRPPVAVRAHFPDRFEAAVRQRARWMTGIALAGWDRLRWDGGLAERWMRLRDRRSVLAAIILAAAYAGSLLDLLCFGLAVRPAWPWAMGRLLDLTSALFLWRLAMRVMALSRDHGWRMGLAAVPRVLLANAIAIAAARRAIAAYVPGRAPRWDKTSHHFPETLPCD